MFRLTRLLNRFEPSLPDQEDEYRRYYLPDDIAQARVVAVIVSAAGFVFIPSDYILFQTSWMFFVLLALRFAFGLSNLMFIRYLRGVRQPKQYEQLAFAWMLVTLAFTIGVNATRPPTFLGLPLLHVTYIFLVYLALPNALIFRVAGALFFSLSALVNLFTLVTANAELFIIAAVFALIVANFVGFVTSTRIYNYRRSQFSASEEAERLNIQLTMLAESDSLTGVLNRRKLLEHGAEEFARFVRYQRPFSIAMMDLDFFKRVNDQHGHAVGDRILVLFTEIVGRDKRATDKLGRIGGEEFALLLPETAEVFAAHIAERIRMEFQASETVAALAGYPLTVSIGIGSARSQDKDFEDILQRADEALYRAKQKGRNRVEL